ncbi:MAG: BolA/IbaG family iron-sulfur metabolism protein [Gammaproteobacteria bacterium]|nr:BolA/IbaG family iron-sulfur metabolism protein [Gammaproteobacteria bacterium]
MTMQATISSKIQDAIQPLHLQVENESHMHNVPAGSESHFKIVVVSEQFDGQMLIKRHRLINQILSEELQQIHAMALHTMTPDEWAQKGAAPESPPCQGGSK